MGMQTLSTDELELVKRIDSLPRAQKEALMARVKAKQNPEVKAWYCTRGRACDGRRHAGFDYPHARGDQWPPVGVDWDTWFYMSGRGTGKTAAGGNWARQMSRVTPRIALIGRRGKDVRQTMVEGPAGLRVACELAGESYDWKPALMEFTFENGAKAFGYSGEEPESLRGPEHGAGWIDEPCHIVLIQEVWSNYTLGLRSQGVPGGAKTLLTSSPLPVPWTKERIAEQGQLLLDEFGDPQIDEEGEEVRAPRTVLVSVPTSVNLHNLDAGYKRRVINPLRGTRKGKQELDAMLLEDVEGALWEADWLSRKRIRRADLERVVVAIDPSGSDAKTADECGLVVCGKLGDNYYVLADHTAQYTPAGWAAKAQEIYEKWEADAIVIERYGGASATTILRQTKYKGGDGFRGHIIEVKARVGKKLRAEPISGLYEQCLVSHLEGADLVALEDQMLTWVPGITPGSPDHVDALVYGLTELSTGKRRKPATITRPRSREESRTRNRGPGSEYARKNWKQGLRK